MEEKILCPWCGAEMEARAHKNRSNAIGWTKCQNIDCGADGPIVTGKTAVECANKARAAALRRYTPPIKPMTLEEVDEHVRSNDANPLWIEDKTGYPSDEWILAGTVWQMCKIMSNRDEYGKTWRCWSRKPTDEKRRAAEWET